MRVLQIEDDAATAQSVELMLKSEKMHTYTTDLGEEGIELAKLYHYDIILLDLNLPDISGYEVLRTLRLSKVNTPIMIVSGLAGIGDKVKGLALGADDYLTKPFHKDELIARIFAITRRAKGLDMLPKIDLGEGLSLDTNSKKLTHDGHVIPLTGKEYEILEFIAERKGKTVLKEEIYLQIYGDRPENSSISNTPEPKTIDVFICKIRKKLETAVEKNLIETIWGRGYALPLTEVIVSKAQDMNGTKDHSLSDIWTPEYYEGHMPFNNMSFSVPVMTPQNIKTSFAKPSYVEVTFSPLKL